MKNPYEVLGINEGASEEDIKLAYREMVKKYHPDKYVNNPLKDLAEEKMREINEAYDYLIKNSGRSSSSSQANNQSSYNRGSQGNYQSSYSGGSSSGNEAFQNIRSYINRNDINTAESMLNNIGLKTAEWYFLHGVIQMKKGWYSGAYQDLQRAVNMDPNNFEYREALKRATASNNTYRNYSYNTNNRKSSSDVCDILTCCCCTDMLCNCL